MAKQSTRKENVHTCTYCGKQFKGKSRLRVHEAIHTGQKDFKCTFCPYSTYNKTNLIIHIRSHTKEKPFKCSHPNCFAAFSTSHSLKNHELSHKKDDESLLKFRCQVSGCDFKTYKKAYLTDHSKIHLNARSFTCDLCPYRAKQRLCLNKHHKNVHSIEKPFKCPQANCNYSCKHRYSLTDHLKLHADERTFVCPFPECTYKANTRGKLRRHQNIHSKTKSFKCSFCPFSALTRGNLTGHIRVHTGETPYSCKSCPYRAKLLGSLTRHVKRWHSGITTRSSKYKEIRRSIIPSLSRVFKCKVENCGFSTSENSDLAIHLNNVHSLPKVVLVISI